MMFQICVASVIAVLAQLALHWLPWKMLLGRELPRPAAYALGTLAISLPLTGLFLAWGIVEAVLALWSVVIGSGAAVAGAYLLDAWLHARQAHKECIEREQALIDHVVSAAN